PVAPHLRLNRPVTVADLHLHRSADERVIGDEEIQIAGPKPVTQQILAATHPQHVVLRLERKHVPAITSTQANSATLSDRVPSEAAVPAEHSVPPIADFSLLEHCVVGAKRFHQDRAVVPPVDETDVLAFSFVPHREIETSRPLTHL